MKSLTKVSIITVSYNSESTVRETIESIIGQDYQNIEYIIVDGNSTDNTSSIVKSYGSKISKFVSEKDNGLYDAMNKGIRMATGDIIGIINSDDIYSSQNIISKVVAIFETKSVDVVYGDLYYFRTGFPDIPIRNYKGKIFSLTRAKYGLMPPHPTFFIKKKTYEKYGYFDTNFTLSADFDLILRFLGIHKVSFEYIPEILVKMRMGGKSTSSLKRVVTMNRESMLACKKNGIRTNVFKFHIKYLIKVFSVSGFREIIYLFGSYSK
jgi:glycosyltransferase involved in cell wall biosynthesis